MPFEENESMYFCWVNDEFGEKPALLSCLVTMPFVGKEVPSYTTCSSDHVIGVDSCNSEN
jgi:hypothetical protein